VGRFDKYAVNNCKHCKHPERNPEGNCNYSGAKVYMTEDGRRRMVKGICKNSGRRSTTFMKHDPRFLQG